MKALIAHKRNDSSKPTPLGEPPNLGIKGLVSEAKCLIAAVLMEDVELAWK